MAKTRPKKQKKPKRRRKIRIPRKREILIKRKRRRRIVRVLLPHPRMMTKKIWSQS